MKCNIHFRKYLSVAVLLLFIHMSATAQNECSTAVTLISSTGCNNTNINLSSATASASIPLGCAAAGTYNDYWYRFTAVATLHTITLSNLGPRITAPRIQLYSGTCGSLTSVGCSSSPHTSLTQTGLTIGVTYYVRISQFGSFGASGNYRMDVCITHPQPPPSNDDCSGATVLTPSATCTNTSGTLFYAASSSTAGGSAPCVTGTLYDVWYRFTATSTTHAITLSSLGSNLTATSTYIQVFSGSCGSLTSISCNTASSRTVLTSLTAGTSYYIRIYITNNPTVLPSTAWTFNICVQSSPTNDDCSGAITLTPNASCTNTAGTLDLATVSTPTVGCATGTNFDVWYQFTATTLSHTINLSSLGSNITAQRIQIYSGACGSLTSLGCSITPSLTQAGLLIGTSYYIRISNNGTNPSGTGGVAGFNICVITGAIPNDACSTPIVLTSNSTCNPTNGTLFGATASLAAIVTGSCGTQNASDVWYSFVAQAAYPTISFTNNGIPIASTNRASVQLLSGSCGSFTSLICNNYNTSFGTPVSIVTTGVNSGAGLTVGQTYYIRIFSNQITVPTSSWTFSLCVQDPSSGTITLETAKTYVNITNATGGGTVVVGNVLEIRSTFYLSAGTIDSLSFQDTLKAGAGFAYQAGNLALRTNEGKIYPIASAAYTEAVDADAAFAVGSGVGTDTIIRINMGTSPTSARGGTAVATTTLPRGSGRHLVMATYRVQVTGVEGTRINYGGGSFRYRNQNTGVFTTIALPRDSLIVYTSPAVCPNAVSSTNVIGDEFNGTFGTATGTGQTNRTASLNTTYGYTTFTSNSPGDNFHGITNNTAAAGTVTTTTLAKPAAAGNRVFSVWDISGDHTGATNQAKGNPPCNSSLPVSSTNPCGYMMVINSSYRTDNAFQFNVNNACPNTFYEVSAWFKNVCYKCGADEDGTGSFYGGGDNIYRATGTGDSSGVKPNITFKVNNLDYYSTGDIQYQGLGGTQTGSDTLNNWVKRAFVYKTDSVTTSFTLTLRNNAPGAGGNDWAIDDISFKTCSPTLAMNPSTTPTYCQNGQIDMSVIVASYYNTYQYYQWERSIDGGNTWTAAPELPSVQSFTYTNISGEYRDTVVYPSILATSAMNGYRYRIKVATSISGLSTSCAVFNSDDEILITVQTLCTVLPVELLKFNVQLNEDKAQLTWTAKEDAVNGYTIERSTDAVHFNYVGYVNAKGKYGSEEFYSFNDPTPVIGKVYYRLRISTLITAANKYSDVLSVSLIKNNGLEIANLVNPFQTKITFQLNAYRNELVELQLTDALGHPLMSKKVTVSKGANAISFDVPQHLQKGSYLLRIVSTSGVINKIIQKL